MKVNLWQFLSQQCESLLCFGNIKADSRPTRFFHVDRPINIVLVGRLEQLHKNIPHRLHLSITKFFYHYIYQSQSLLIITFINHKVFLSLHLSITKFTYHYIYQSQSFLIITFINHKVYLSLHLSITKFSYHYIYQSQSFFIITFINHKVYLSLHLSITKFTYHYIYQSQSFFIITFINHKVYLSLHLSITKFTYHYIYQSQSFLIGQPLTDDRPTAFTFGRLIKWSANSKPIAKSQIEKKCFHIFCRPAESRLSVGLMEHSAVQLPPKLNNSYLGLKTRGSLQKE